MWGKMGAVLLLWNWGKGRKGAGEKGERELGCRGAKGEGMGKGGKSSCYLSKSQRDKGLLCYDVNNDLKA